MQSKKTNRKDIISKKSPEKSKPPKLRISRWWMSLLVILPVTFFVLSPCLSNGFTNWDDPTYILDNPLIRQLSFGNIKKIFSEVYFSNYQPLHIFSYALEYHFFKDQPDGYHAVSVLMHLGNTALVLWLAWLITGNQVITIFTGLIFGIHPLHVESIAWAAERKDLLYAMFLFLSLIFYVKYVQSQEKFKFLVYAFMFFVLSIFSKAMAAALPPVLVLFDFYFRRKLSRKLVIEKLPFFILAIVMGLISVYASQESGSIATRESFGYTDRFFFACHNLLQYFLKLILPLNLSAYYPYPEKIQGTLAWYYYLSPAICLAILGGCLYSLKFTRIVFLYLGFFVITIFLVLQLLPVGPAIFSERYSYIPSFGFFLLLGTGFEKLTNGTMKKYQSIKPGIVILTGVWAIWLCVLTYERCGIWKNSITLWDNVLAQFDKALHALNNRADAYYKNGNYELAVADLTKAIQLNETYDMAWYNRGNAYGQLGKFKEAFNDLDQAIKLDPDNADAYNKRGQAYAVLGNKEAAFEDFRKASGLNPDNPEIYYNIGITWINSGNKEEACKALIKASNLNYQPALKAYSEICK